MKLKIGKYEIIIQKTYFNGFHITDNSGSMPESPEYVHDFSHARRLSALIREHGMIDYTFRNLDSALIAYGADVIQLIDCVIECYGKIRMALIKAKMSEEMLVQYDNKIYDSFNKLIVVLENRKDLSNAKILRDIDIVSSLKKCESLRCRNDCKVNIT